MGVILSLPCLQIHTAEEGALAAAGGANDRDNFSTTDMLADSFEHLYVSKALRQILYFNQGVSSSVPQW